MIMLLGLIIIALALIFPFLHFRYGNTVFRVLGLIGAGICCLSLMGIVMSFLQVGTSAPHVGVPLFLIAVIFQAFYLSIKTRKPQKPRAGEDILDS